MPARTRPLALLLALAGTGCLPALGTPGPPDANAAATLAGGARLQAPARPSFATARLVGASDEEDVWGGSGRATIIGQLAWDGEHPGGDRGATVAADPRVGAGGTVSWSHLRLHGEVTGWASPVLTASSYGGDGSIGAAASVSTFVGPAELYLAGDAAAGGWYQGELGGHKTQDREVASAVLGAAVHAGAVCVFVAGGPSRVAQHGSESDDASKRFHFAESAWTATLGLRLEAEPDSE